jgi:hypothetical protein
MDPIRRRTRAGGAVASLSATVLAVLIAAGLAGAEIPMDESFGSRATPVYKPIPGKAVGIVVMDPRAVVAAEQRFGPPGAAGVSYDGGSYRWFYVTAPPGTEGESLTFGAWPASERQESVDHLILATPETLKARGIRAPYCLVQVVVNGGAGSGPEDSFAATGLTVVEGSEHYPLKVAEVVGRIERSYHSQLPQLLKQKSVQEKLKEARKAAGEVEPSPGSKASQLTTDTRTYVTWLPRTERLRIELFTRLREGKYAYGRGVEPVNPDNPRADPHAPGEPPPSQGIRYGVEYGVDTVMIYEIPKSGGIPMTRAGEIVGRALPAKIFVERRGPPGAPPAGPAPGAP